MNEMKKVADFVRDDMEWLCSAHDFFHIQKVADNVHKICEMEWEGDRNIATASAYLHEYFDEKFFDASQLWEREEKLIVLLDMIEVTKDDQKHILHIIKNVWYGKSLERNKDFKYTTEFKIVEDADRLEAIWAIAIARMFAYGWTKGRPIYDPNITKGVIGNDSEYRNNSENNTSFNHFYEKLLLLKDLMHTKSWRELAIPRHEYMEGYMKMFLEEWEGKR